LSEPVSLASAGDDRLFVLERAGVIKVIQPNGDVLPTPFLDITSRVDSSDDEEGLLGLAFHPEYSTNGYFYVNYVNTTATVRRTRIARFTVTTDTNVADPNSEEILLTVEQPFRNHNAGDIHFGPDGLLYIPLGDGGDSNDPNNNAQQLDRLLGKIVRINVDADSGTPADCFGIGTGNYTVPADNPYVDGSGNQCDEIWASGLRNPWRSTFDRQTGDLYLGDVGQGAWEEVDLYPVGEAGGLNFGWRCYEGNHDNVTTGCGPMSSYTAPIFEYSSDGTGNCTVIGGYVYRGSLYPAMVGHYLLADYCSGRVWDLVRNGDTWQATEHTNIANGGYVAFGQDAAGELYLVRQNGTIYAIQENSLLLSISKSGPNMVLPGEPLTYTLTITNSSLMTATNLVITDTLPSGANYLPGSGGNLVGDVVSWTIPSLAGGGSVTQTTFAVTTTQTISNSDYRVSADGDQSAVGTVIVLTAAVDAWNYLPLITK
jgi:uncharacterized repeat protein (TIGR01451 family)